MNESLKIHKKILNQNSETRFWKPLLAPSNGTTFMTMDTILHVLELKMSKSLIAQYMLPNLVSMATIKNVQTANFLANT